MRATTEVRLADVADLPTVAEMCLAARAETGTPAQICLPDTQKLQRQLGVLLSVPGGRIYVAHQDDALAGFMLARVIEANIYSDEPVLYIEAIYVAKQHRRRGAGHALLLEAAHAATDEGADEVYSVPIPGSRGVQRFLARLGFAPAAAHRVAPTALLLRRLEAEGNHSRRGTRSLEDLIARRRKERIETQSGPVDLRELHRRLGQAPSAGSPDSPDADPADSAEAGDSADDAQGAQVFDLEKTIDYPPSRRATRLPRSAG